MQPPTDPTPGEVYYHLLDSLRKANAEPLALEIDRTFARGVVLAGQETHLYRSSSVYRRMEEKEALAVAIEFLVTALEIPLMLNATQRTVDNVSIEWRLERPGSEREDVAIGTTGEVDVQALRSLLTKLIEIAHELGINLPEIV